MDADGAATASVVAKPIKPEDQHKSLRERAEAEIELQKKALKDFKVREGGIQEQNDRWLAGREFDRRLPR